MENEQIESFHAYSGAVDQRYAGAQKLQNLELLGCVRSMNLRLDDFPHTGAQSYGNLPKSQYIPGSY
jgi:hypothetical protein